MGKASRDKRVGAWTDVAGMSVEVSNQLVPGVTAISLASQCVNSGIIPPGEATSQLIDTANKLAENTRAAQDQINAIRPRHTRPDGELMQGKAKRESHTMQAMEIGMQYIEVNDFISQNVIPLQMEIMETCRNYSNDAVDSTAQPDSTEGAVNE